MTRLKETLRRGDIAYGTFCALKDPAVVELLGYVGYDFAVIDLEHSSLDLSTMEHFIRAAQIGGISSVIRTPQMDFATILRAVEAGADAIMVPHIVSREMAEKVVATAKYPPVGMRGIDGSTRVARYGGVKMVEHMKVQNERLLVIGMIEDREAVEQIDDIVTTPGLDLLFVGASDLSCSYGLPTQVTHPTVRAALEKILSSASKAGVKVGIPGFDPQQAKDLAEMGYGFITSPAVDTFHLTQTLTAHLQALKEAAKPSPRRAA
jgi:4-hydroxy-2-oxoheptanedioate aldolase